MSASVNKFLQYVLQKILRRNQDRGDVIQIGKAAGGTIQPIVPAHIKRVQLAALLDHQIHFAAIAGLPEV